jgi:esterase/lipase superfamily enzyme
MRQKSKLKRMSRLLVALLLLCHCLPAYSQSNASSKDQTVFYVTTRSNANPRGSRPTYTGARHLNIGLGDGSTEYGQAVFSRPGYGTLLGSPNWAQLRTEMAKRDLFWTTARVKQLDRFSDQEFFNRIKNFRGLICVYIHGYDMTFEQSAREVAELADEFQNRAPGQAILPLVFSWPSTANKADYTGDEASLEWSEAPFREFINRLAAEKNSESSIDLVAHSMGARLAFWYGTAQAPLISTAPFRNIFLSCADVDYHTAEQRKADLQKCAQRTVFVLTNDNDGPLLSSQALHAQTRLGRPFDGGVAIRQIVAPAKPGVAQPDLLSTVTSLFPDKMQAGQKQNEGLAKFAFNTFLNSGASTKTAPQQATGEASDVQAWLSKNPYLSREWGPKAQLVDDTGLVTTNMGHRIAWPLLAGLMLSDPSYAPFVTGVVHKRPDVSLLREMGGTPTYLYRYNKIDLSRLTR